MPAPNATELARETIRQLAARKLAPTPENYGRIYAQVAGANPDGGPAAVFDALAEVVPGRALLLTRIARAAEAGQWDQVQAGLQTLIGDRRTEEWAALSSLLAKEMETPRADLDGRSKAEFVARLARECAGNDGVFHRKLRVLLDSWTALPRADGTVAPAPGTGEALGADLAILLGDVLELGVAPRLTRAPALAAEVVSLAGEARSLVSRERAAGFARRLKEFWYRAELSTGLDLEMVEGLTRLLRLIVDSIGELVSDEQWVKGQIEVIQKIISGPLDRQAILAAEKGFRELIFKQGTLKASLDDARETLREMVGSFIARLGEMSEHTSEYHGRMEHYALRVAEAHDLRELGSLVEELGRDIRVMQLDMQRSHDELVAARRKVEIAELRIGELELELAHVSDKVREDTLTGTLNRRGMEEAIAREFARAERTRRPLSVAMLDLDHFKKLNDTYGHQAGDQALRHLVAVVRDTLRPTDPLARYGGEEFLILLPETPLREAVKVMTRLQQELTRRHFLHGNESLLITFSAGVAERDRDEPAESVIDRADKAVYVAKEAGRNRVETAAARPA